MPKVYLTGASSFTGFHFATSLIESGFDVGISLSRSFESYEGNYKHRLGILKPNVEIFENSSFGSERFISSLENFAPDILSLHHAKVGNFRSPDFSSNEVIRNNTNNIEKIADSGILDKMKAIVLTRSVFEKDVGYSDKLEDVGEYGKSKSGTYKIFKKNLRNKIDLYSFGIANPFGVLEEKRLPNYLIQNWRAAKKPILLSPDRVRDNIPVNFLAKSYCNYLISILEGVESKKEFTPSMQIQTNYEFARLISLYSNIFLNKANLDVLCAPKEDWDNSEPRILIGLDSLPSPDTNEITEFWQDYISYLWEESI